MTKNRPRADKYNAAGLILIVDRRPSCDLLSSVKAWDVRRLPWSSLLDAGRRGEDLAELATAAPQDVAEKE